MYSAAFSRCTSMPIQSSRLRLATACISTAVADMRMSVPAIRKLSFLGYVGSRRPRANIWQSSCEASQQGGFSSLRCSAVLAKLSYLLGAGSSQWPRRRDSRWVRTSCLHGNLKNELTGGLTQFNAPVHFGGFSHGKHPRNWHLQPAGHYAADDVSDAYPPCF